MNQTAVNIAYAFLTLTYLHSKIHKVKYTSSLLLQY